MVVSSLYSLQVKRRNFFPLLLQLQEFLLLSFLFFLEKRIQFQFFEVFFEEKESMAFLSLWKI